LGALGVGNGGAVGLPATATRPLVEDVKRCGARPQFCDLDDALTLERPGANVAVIWSQSLAGLPIGVALTTGDDGPRVWRVLENPDTVPGPIHTVPGPIRAPVDIELHALHLNANPETSGAILIVHDSELACRLRAALSEVEAQPDPLACQAQLWRLADLARRQSERVAELRRGLTGAAGLALLADSPSMLPGGVAVQIPPEADPATFFAYVKAENTPVAWLPELRPLHYAAVRQGAGLLETGRRLARWLMIPVGPDDTPEEIGHAVLGVVKAADYLGVRWRLDPERAAAYARLMDEWYGLDHDAYRPVFVTPEPGASQVLRDPELP